MSRIVLPLLLAAVMVWTVTGHSRAAQAQACCVCGCECEDSSQNQPLSRETVTLEHRRTRVYFGTAASHVSMKLQDWPPYAGADITQIDSWQPNFPQDGVTGELDPPSNDPQVVNDLNHGGVSEGERQIPHREWKNRDPRHVKYELGEVLTLDNAVPRPPLGEYDDALGKTSGTGEMGIHQNWIIEQLFFENILPAMMRMQQQFTATMMHQAFMTGTFFDADIQMDTTRQLQRLQGEAHKDYHPNVGMCVFGTNVRSLTTADFKADLTATVLSRRDIQRQLANADGVGTHGYDVDLSGRIDHFKKNYCDIYDNNNLDGGKKAITGFAPICEAAGPTKRSMNMDVDYTRTVLTPRTLNLNFDDQNPTTDEQAIMALSTSLYGHKTFSVIAPDLLKPADNQDDYLDLRAVVAKRSVAQNSFNAIVALKTEGSKTSEDTTYPYMKLILKELGIENEQEIKAWLGSACTDKTFCPQPSYMAQMEILAKKIYQRPEFYTELYDKPVNTKRRGVAMQAIGVMLDRDLYKSQLRSEAIMSTLLEMRVIDEQDRVLNNAGLAESSPP